jgi:hypothetical protein
MLIRCPREIALAFIDDPTTAPDAAYIERMSGLRFTVR